MTSPTSAQLADIVARVDRFTRELDGRPVVTADGTLVGWFTRCWDVKKSDGSIVLYLRPDLTPPPEPLALDLSAPLARQPWITLPPGCTLRQAGEYEQRVELEKVGPATYAVVGTDPADAPAVVEAPPDADPEA